MLPEQSNHLFPILLGRRSAFLREGDLLPLNPLKGTLSFYSFGRRSVFPREGDPLVTEAPFCAKETPWSPKRLFARRRPLLPFPLAPLLPLSLAPFTSNTPSQPTLLNSTWLLAIPYCRQEKYPS